MAIDTTWFYLWVLRLDNTQSFKKHKDNFRLVVAKDRRSAELMIYKFYKDVYGHSYFNKPNFPNMPDHYTVPKVYPIQMFIKDVACRLLGRKRWQLL